MKKVFLLVVCLAVALSAVSFAEENLFETLSGLDWSFSSGVGGWETYLLIKADGSFVGDYHDSEMGETADEYPNGTVYFCTFSGRMSLAGQVDENTWKIHIDSLEADKGQEMIENEIRYVPTDVYGLSAGDDMLLYAPGTPVSVFTEEMLMWTHMLDQEETPVTLDNWFLSSEKNDSGFVGYEPVSVANPWEDLTAEELKEASGLSFGVPEGAEGIIYRYLRSEGMAEMQFSWSGGEYCARIQPMALEENDLYDISGMYYEWTYEEPVEIGTCFGSISQAQQEDESWVERCLWYDADARLMYSLSVKAADIDGLDLTALAEQISARVAQ